MENDWNAENIFMLYINAEWLSSFLVNFYKDYHTYDKCYCIYNVNFVCYLRYGICFVYVFASSEFESTYVYLIWFTVYMYLMIVYDNWEYVNYLSF